MGLKYVKTDGQLLISALNHNLEVANQITEDLKSGSRHLLSKLSGSNPSLSGKAYQSAGTLFQSIVNPALDKLKQATEGVRKDVKQFENDIKIFDEYPDPIYDRDKLQQLLELKRLQKFTVESQMHYFNNLLLDSLASSAVENVVYEGRRLESIAHQYEKEIKEIEDKKKRLEYFASKTSSLFTSSLETFKNAMASVKALKNGHFNSDGNFTFSSQMDKSFYEHFIGKKFSKKYMADDVELTDFQQAQVAKMNKETVSQLKKIAKASGVTFSALLNNFIEDEKAKISATGKGFNSAWDYISGEFSKVTQKNTSISDNDKILITTVTYTDPDSEVQHGAEFIVNKSTDQIISQKNRGLLGEFGSYIESRIGSKIESIPENAIKNEKYKTKLKDYETQNASLQKSEMFTGAFSSIQKATGIRDSFTTESKTYSGKEYKSNLQKKERNNQKNSQIKLEEERIRNLQNQSKYNGRG